jgi:ABC-type transporter Mla maintaining outer membrane lipid asymmetry permease subunit MlaE
LLQQKFGFIKLNQKDYFISQVPIDLSLDVLAMINIFSFIISTVPCYFGYNVKGGALEIGKAGTQSVVVSCILILIADYLVAAIAI